MIAIPSQLLAPLRVTAELTRISERLEAVLHRLNCDFGIDTIYIGAGSALAILDHCLFGKDLVMRDLDIFACLESEMTAEMARAMGQALDGPKIGKFSPHDVRPRRRGNPRLPLPEAYQYNSGYGLFLIDAEDQILDLTVFHSKQDMHLNGIMNVDKVRIRLEPGTSLVEQLQPLFDTPSIEMQSVGVEDEHEGYSSWVAGTAELVNDFDVRRAPLQTILRIIRTFGKYEKPSISTRTKQELHHLMSLDRDGATAFYTVRGLIKLLHDRNAVWGLRLLKEIGGLQKLGGIVRQLIEPLFQGIDRFEASHTEVRLQLLLVAKELAVVEHQMKLKGVC